MDEEITEFFLNSKSEIIQYECLEISHPDFSQVFRFVRNNTEGLTVTLETLADVTFDYCPVRIKQSNLVDDLDYGIELEFGDLGEILPDEIDLVGLADGFAVKPTLKYRSYRSDNLTAPMFGPLTLEITSFAFNKTGATFEAKAPSLNIHQTGEIYTISRFPMLRGFL